MLRAAINMTNRMKDLSALSLDSLNSSPSVAADNVGGVGQRTPKRIRGQYLKEFGVEAVTPTGQSPKAPNGLGMNGGKKKVELLSRDSSIEREKQRVSDHKRKIERNTPISPDMSRSDEEIDKEREGNRNRDRDRDMDKENGIHTQSLKEMMNKVRRLENELIRHDKGNNKTIGTGIEIGIGVGMSQRDDSENQKNFLSDLRKRVLEVENIINDNNNHQKNLWDIERTNLLNTVQYEKDQIINLKQIQEGAVLALRTRYQKMLDQAQEALEIQTVAARNQIDRLEEILRKSQIQLQLNKIVPIKDRKDDNKSKNKDEGRGKGGERGKGGLRGYDDKNENENGKENENESESDEGVDIINDTNRSTIPSSSSSSTSTSSSSSSTAAAMLPLLSLSDSPILLSVSPIDEVSSLKILVNQTKNELEIAKKCNIEKESFNHTEIEKIKTEFSLHNSSKEKIILDLERRIIELQDEVSILNTKNQNMLTITNQSILHEKERTYVDVQKDLRDGTYDFGNELGRRRRNVDEENRKRKEDDEQEKLEEGKEEKDEEEEIKRRENKYGKKNKNETESDNEKNKEKGVDIGKQKQFELLICLKQAEDQIFHLERKYEAKCIEFEEKLR